MDALTDIFNLLHQAFFEGLVQPFLMAIGWAGYLEPAFEGSMWLLFGFGQILVLLLVLGPLQRWRPVEPVIDIATVRTDMIYTLIHRLGLFKLGMFFLLEPLMDAFMGQMSLWGWVPPQLDNLWPGVTDQALVSFLLYLLVFDLVHYGIHRAQHQIGWWWKLHALHHAQRQMTMWSDNRNHLLDDVLTSALLALCAQFIGLPPSQFVALVVLTQLSESFQHANLRLDFGRWGERLWVSPRFHRLHHSIGEGHESVQPDSGRVVLGGHNFGVLLPWWDMLFGTANFKSGYGPTGVRDQVEQGRIYGKGFWSQQWLGLQRLRNRA
jgi:sterol desaturase/sphingolipid hydroxylase (fatty acid hydroxylase superfamily)